MTAQRSFLRKIVYLAIVAVLLLPLYWLGRPATGGSQPSPGGYLARIRAERGLMESQLGDIDPTSETMRLVTLGMRGVAISLLWHKADTYKKKKDWTHLSATLQQLVKLEPHFIGVWRFQAWNLSYNVSVEFDDYRKRYEWVMRGIKFLQQGVRYNRREPRILWDLGWFISQKIGVADEWRQFRRLFKQDDEFHGARPVQLRDNWLVGKEWHQKAVDLVDRQGVPLRFLSPLLFYARPPMCQMYYSEYLERDGIFGERAKNAWKRALEEWLAYGDRELPTSGGETVRLNDREMYQEQAKKFAAELDKLAPGLREKILAEKKELLSDEEREALETPEEDRTADQYALAIAAQRKLYVSHDEVANRVKGPNREKARELAKKAKEAEDRAREIGSYRHIVNFEYWRQRARFEQTDLALDARRYIYEGAQAFKNGDLVRAKEYYEKGFEKWRQLLDSPEFPELIEDRTTGRDLVEMILEYRRVLDACDEPFPENFILQDIIDLYHGTVEGGDQLPVSDKAKAKQRAEQEESDQQPRQEEEIPLL